MDDPRQAALQLLRSHGFSDSQVFSLFTDKPASEADKRASEVTPPARADSMSLVSVFMTPPKAARRRFAVSPGSSPRPVSWSLHKYFTADSPGPEKTVLVPAIKPRGNSELARQETQEAEEDRLVVLDRLPEHSQRMCQKAAVRPYQRQRGGRPKRAPDAPREIRIAASAGTKHEWCQWIYAQTAKGTSLANCFRQVSRETGCSQPTIRLWWKQRARWNTWVEQHPEEGRTGRRRQGCNLSLSKMKSCSTGKKVSQT